MMKSTKFWMVVAHLFISASLMAGGLGGIKSEITPFEGGLKDASERRWVFAECVTRFEADMNCRDACERKHGERVPWSLKHEDSKCEFEYYMPMGCYCSAYVK